MLDTRHKESLSDCVQSILVNISVRVTSAAELQSVFDSVLSTARATNAKYAYRWNCRQQDNSFSRLPDELLINCLTFLQPADWIRATLVSHRWHKLVDTPLVWSKVTVRYPPRLASDGAKVSWLRSYLAKSADASLDIQWCPHVISTLELELISTNMHRMAHFEALHPMDMAFLSPMLGQRALRLETLCLRPPVGTARGASDVFDFKIAFGMDPPVNLRRLHVGLFTLPIGSQCLVTVTNFEGILRTGDVSNLQLFRILPNISAATLWLQARAVLPSGPFPATLQTVHFKDVNLLASDMTTAWEPLLASAIYPIHTVSFDVIRNLDIPFELFKRAVPNQWKLVAMDAMNPFSFAIFTRFTMTPADSSTKSTISHTFCAMEHRWKSFISSPSGAISVARSGLLVSLKLTSRTFCALLKATADLPALLSFTLFTSTGTDLPRKYEIHSEVGSLAPVRVNRLRDFILELEAHTCRTAARWFTKFLPCHIRDLFEYEQPRLKRLAFVAETLGSGGFEDDHAWGGVAQLADEVHVGVSLNSLPLLVPSEADDMPDGSDWEPEEEDYMDEEDNDDYDEPYSGYGSDDYDDYGESGYDWQ